MNASDTLAQGDSIEYAGNTIDRHDLIDSSAPNLLEVTGISQHRMATASGLNDYDYQKLSTLTRNESIHLNQLETVGKVPIPPEVMEHFKHIKCHCMMGLFPEIGRAWLTIDSDIYIWTYENSRDVAYYDGLNHLIISVGLVKPKPDVFIADVKYLLVITTTIEIVVLGVIFGDSSNTLTSPAQQQYDANTSVYDEMQLMSKPIFILNTDNVAITTVCGTADHRIFLGGRDGCLFEIYYQAESNWFGSRCKKINHSQGLMSYMVPGFLKVFSDIDSIAKIVVDNSRRLLYTLTEKGSIEAWVLGTDTGSTKRIARISQNDIVHHASNVLKTVDSSVFKPVVSICPLSQDDSPNLHLLAVTQGGVRLYFATTPLPNPQQQQQLNVSGGGIGAAASAAAAVVGSVDPMKPQNLYLLHVRLPPGYTSNVTVVKPKAVHTAFHNEGTVLMVSTPQQDQDLLWSLSSAPFPLRKYLAESSTLMPLDGQVWSIAEVRAARDEAKLMSALNSAKQNKKVVLLTNQGAHIIALVKPVDMLQQLLLACHGPHHEAVKGYFANQSEAHACATSVLLACMNPGTDIGMWATHAFLLYGGIAQYGGMARNFNMSATFADQQQQHQRSSQMYMSTPFAPSRSAAAVQQSLAHQTQYPLSPIASTSFGFSPQHPDAGGALNDPVTISYSSKHAGLYLHVCRLMRPLWRKKCLLLPPPGSSNFHSSISHLDCAAVLDDLYAVRSFIERLPMNNVTGYLQNYGNQNTLVNSVGSAFGNTFADHAGAQQRYAPERANAEENKSINALANLIKHTCEVISLWKILCEHQFHVLLQAMPNEELNLLASCTFRDLILSRADTCALLIVSLINTYLNDNASVGSISEKLRDVCPNLYRHEDAVSHKATEILMTSKTCLDSEEQQDKLYTALQLCKGAAPNLPLPSICKQFTAANFHQGVIELCATCAEKIDPNGAALHYYKSMEPVEDQEGYMAFSARMQCYKEITIMLDTFYLNCSQQTSKFGQEHTAANNENGTSNLNSKILQIVSIALQTGDQLLHIAVYGWLLSHKLLAELLNISEPSLGEFLTHSFERDPENLHLADILWKYHERNGQHAAATAILDNLASMHSNSIPLQQRIEYLARAVMCMRCDTVGYSAHNGILLKNLEDKLEIARVQKLLLDALACLQSTDARDAVKQLNYTLYTITQLYTDYAEPFELWECKLTILNCSHHNDPLLIESVWTQILNAQFNQPAGSALEKSGRLLAKVKTLAAEHGNSGHCFPVSFLVHELELRCCQLRMEHSPVPEALVAMGLDIDQLLDIYGSMVSMNERIWATAGNEWHLVQATTQLVAMLAAQPNLVQARNRRRLYSKAQELTSACRNLLYPKPGTKHLIDALVEIEQRLQRA